MTTKQCAYCAQDGFRCDEPVQEAGYCYWHDTEVIKKGEDVVYKLEQRALTGRSMRGFSLRHANLKGINLVNNGSALGYDLRECDLYRADVSFAHLFGIQLQGSSLMKADFSGSNLHKANITDCNLLGIKFHESKLEYIEWGKRLIQEAQVKRLSNVQDHAFNHDLLQQAEEIYRKLRLETERQGLPEMAGVFFQREMAVRRKQLRFLSFERMISKAVDLFCGYGEKPLRVIGFSMTLIGLSAIAYFFFGLSHADSIIGLDTQASVVDNTYDFLECLYFSVITFTTLGYGDIVPTDFARLIAAIEAFCGSFTLALFVVVFVKKMTR